METENQLMLRLPPAEFSLCTMCQGSQFQIPDLLLSCFMMLLPMIFMESIEKEQFTTIKISPSCKRLCNNSCTFEK
jgi:hypothetical protein